MTATELGVGRGLWTVGPRMLELREEVVPPPRPDEITVQATTSLISAGTEMLVFRGAATPGEPLPPTSVGVLPYPVKYGYQVVGRVVAAGEDSGYEVGDRVFCRHPHQDLFTIRALPTYVVALPEDVSDDAAAFINLVRVALTAHHDVGVRIGDVAVVFGQGIIGQACARLAGMAASKVIVVDRFASRRDLALRAGAVAAVAPEDAVATVMELTDGQGADIAYEASGAGAAMQSAIEVTGTYGNIVALSHYGTQDVHLRLAPEFHFRRLKITSSQAGDQPRWDWVRRTKATIGLLSALRAEEMVSARIPFDRAQDAYELVETSPADVLGVLMTY